MFEFSLGLLSFVAAGGLFMGLRRAHGYSIWEEKIEADEAVFEAAMRYTLVNLINNPEEEEREVAAILFNIRAGAFESHEVSLQDLAAEIRRLVEDT